MIVNVIFTEGVRKTLPVDSYNPNVEIDGKQWGVTLTFENPPDWEVLTKATMKFLADSAPVARFGQLGCVEILEGTTVVGEVRL